jgi:hypothetical protein
MLDLKFSDFVDDDLLNRIFLPDVLQAPWICANIKLCAQVWKLCPIKLFLIPTCLCIRCVSIIFKSFLLSVMITILDDETDSFDVTVLVLLSVL